MLVFHTQNLVVFAIPKTGSTALEAALAPQASVVVRAPPAQRHMNWGVYSTTWEPVIRQALGGTPEGFAVLREPVERLRSWYRYRSGPQFDGTDLSCAEVGFDGFVDASLSDDPPPFARVGSQDKFVMSRAGEIQIHHLFDHAQMPLALDWLSARLGRKISLGRRNPSPDRPAPLEAGLLDRLRTARAREFDLHSRVASRGHLVSRPGSESD